MVDLTAFGVRESYFSVLRRAILRLPANTTRARRDLYERIEAIQTAVLTARAPPLDPIEIDAEYRLLRHAMRVIESEIRRGADITAENYKFPDLDDTHRLIYASRNTRLARQQAAILKERKRSNLRIADAEILKEDSDRHAARAARRLTLLDASRGHVHVGGVGALRAILIHQFQAIASEDRLALLWLLIQPTILVALILAMYFVLGANFVLNMDVPTFALLGSTTWIMCRQTILRVSTSFVSGRALINIPGVSPLHIAVGQGIIYLVIYSFVFLVLLSIGHMVDLTSLPDRVPGVAIALIGMWLLALFFGLFLGGLATLWPFSLRFASVIERALQLFSSVFFVSEQLPEEYRKYVLWCPAAHGMQIIRDQFFAGYVSMDADPFYFLSSIAVLGILSLLLYHAVRPNLHPL
jgi:ABC-type polysaccharide/polyol phosphate export permease